VLLTTVVLSTAAFDQSAASIVGRTTYFGFLCQPIGPAQSGYDYDRHDDGLIASKATYVGYNL